MKYISRKSTLVALLSFICISLLILSSWLLLTPNPSKSNNNQSFEGIKPLQTMSLDEYNYAKQNSNLYIDSTTPNYYCLRDKYALFTQNQSTMGLCWAFTSNTVLETAFAIKYGEMYDFSESYISIAHKANEPNYLLGSGGHMEAYLDAIERHSIVLEVDMPYETVFGIDDSNYQDILQVQQKQKIILPNIQKIQFLDYNSYSFMKEQIISEIKNHIIYNSAIYCAINSNDMFEYNGYGLCYSDTYTGVNHGVTIIGWDDDFVYDGHKGAWITLNSWGNATDNHGIFYMPYDYVTIGINLFGLTIQENTQDPSVNIIESNSQIQNLYNGQFQYEVDETTLTANYLHQKNIFYSNQGIDLTYSYTINDDDYDIYVQFIDKFNNSYDNFSIEINKDNKTFDINSIDNITDEGTYVLSIQFDYDRDKNIDYTVTKEIFVLNGLEIGTVNIYQLQQEQTSQGFTLKQKLDTTLYFNYNTYNHNKTNFEITTQNDGIMVVIELSSYSSITNYSINNFLYNTDTHISFNSYTNSNFANGQFYLFKNDTTSPSSITFTSNTNNTITYTFSLQKADKVTNTYISYDLDGGRTTNSFTNIITVSDNENEKIYVDTPFKLNYSLQGLYVDKNYTIALDKDENGYYLTSEKLQLIEGSNYYDEALISQGFTPYRYICIIYTKWIKDYSLSFESKNVTYIYGDKIEELFPELINFSSNLSFNLLNSPTFLSIQDRTIVGNALKAGVYNVYLQILDNDKNLDIRVSIKFNIDKRKLVYKIDDQYSDYLQPTVPLTGQVINGEIYNQDDLLISFDTNASNTADAGQYPITAKSENENYQITFIEGTYIINKITLPNDKININHYINEYDGQSHSANIDVLLDDNYTLSYSLDGIVYTNEIPTFINVVDTHYFVKISSMKNYFVKIIELRVKITPRILNVVWDNATLVYNGNEQAPSYEIQNTLDESLDITQDGYYIYPNENYQSSLNIKNQNYILQNNTINYSIDKANFVVDYENYTNTYDAKEHNLIFSVTSTPSTEYKTMYSFDNINYTENILKFKDVQNINVYVKITADYFNDYIFTTNVNITPYTINIVWDETPLKYSGQNQLPKYSYVNELGENLDIIQSGTSIYPNDNYVTTLSIDNKNYLLNNTTFTYSILNGEFNVNYNDYIAEYDALEHTPALQIMNENLTNYKVEYSLDNTNYETNAYTFKNVQNTKIYIKLSADYYNDYYFTINVIITPYVVDIVWGNTTLICDGTKKIPSYTYSNALNEELNIIEFGHQEDYSSNGYEATLTLQGEQLINYQLSNNTCQFNFEKPHIDIPLPQINITQVKNASYLSQIKLPVGYSWVNPSQKLKYGENTYQINYLDKYGELQTFEITINKPKPNYWLPILLSLLGVAILTAIVIYVIKYRKKNALLSVNAKNTTTKQQNKLKLDEKKLDKNIELQEQNRISKTNLTTKEIENKNSNNNNLQNSNKQVNSINKIAPKLPNKKL